MALSLVRGEVLSGGTFFRQIVAADEPPVNLQNVNL